jgi:phage replication O-like protein O
MTEGFVPVPNAYFEYLAELSGAETKVLLAILRKTAGWRKESDAISLSQLEEMTGLDRKSVIAGLRGLLERGLIAQTQASAGSRAASYTCVIPPQGGGKIPPVASGKTPPVEDRGWKNSTTSGFE